MRRRAALAMVTGTVSVLVTLSIPPASADPPKSPDRVAAATDHLVTSRPAMLHSSPQDAYTRQRVIAGQGGLRYTPYTRTYAGLPVHGGDFVVVTDAAGGVLSTSVSQEAALEVSTTPKLSADEAARLARAELSEVASVAAPKLSVMAEGRGRLVYEVVVTGADRGRPSRLHVFVDAGTGAIAQKSEEVMAGVGNSFYNGNPVTFPTRVSGGVYSMTDVMRPGIACGGQNGAPYTGADDSWGNGSGTNLETACVDTMYAIDREWEMLDVWLDRDGFDGLGRGFPARVGLNDVNAYWNGINASFGHTTDNRRQATSMDVVAHEYGHAIFAHTPGQDYGTNEKMILNESSGDIFGALTEHYANQPATLDPPDYMVGEEVNIAGTGPIRYMYRPSILSGHPDCFSSQVPPMMPQVGAGVQNHWFYLLAEGSNPVNGQPPSPTCDNSIIAGLGIRKAGQIFMGTLLRKTQVWTHQRARRASLEAAAQLFPNTCVELKTVRAAWNAVRVPAVAGEPQGCPNFFGVTLTPASVTVPPGGQVNVAVSTVTTVPPAQDISLYATNLPPGTTAAFTPQAITSGTGSTLTVTAGAGTAPGTYYVTVRANGTSTDRIAVLTLTVTA
ncbi:M4 family metallopeptidase [Nonomuraea endophytica]|uniref:Zn-dependent metalloprotease n=1 Tax=Nonomuraea endophytica TaxID=714136 RepID=A0A7W8EN58_9ACTN|nr:M4 family metallopeptidase [Nonomuraea endophytica]MBB5084732.1 Zn-dependent metalloprotease [Nonomuraea endophytica]